MYTIVKSSHGISLVPVETKLLSERKLFIQGEITADMACTFVQSLMLLVKEDAEKPIHVYINSPGGEVTAGLLIYDALQELRTEVHLHCIGIAASMAAIILAGGQKGRRYILPHSKTMIHEPLIAGGVGGSATTIQRTAESILETKRITTELLAKDTGKTPKEVARAIAFDNYMNAQETVAFGLCDHIETTLIGG